MRRIVVVGVILMTFILSACTGSSEPEQSANSDTEVSATPQPHVVEENEIVPGFRGGCLDGPRTIFTQEQFTANKDGTGGYGALVRVLSMEWAGQLDCKETTRWSMSAGTTAASH